MAHAELSHLFDEYAQDLQRFLTSRVSCQATAADLTQETFLRLAQLPNLQTIDNIRAYVFWIAANLATDHLRAKRRSPLTTDEETLSPELPDSASTPETALSAKQELSVTMEAFQELSPLCRQIFALSRFDGLPHRDIAAKLGICVSTVEKNIARAVNHCRRRINESAE